jgi:quinol-cytochrome oxidoreductase complex cytochrome b subunit
MGKLFSKIKSLFFFDTFGAISIANLIICSITGVIIAVPFDINAPYDSISLLMISNPAASFFRNMHYWSAQFFLIFSLLHIWDYLNIDKAFRLKHGVWIRVIISILFIIYVMISGFILKADADSLQARRIIESLIDSIPFAGSLISAIFLGQEGSFQLIYVHHIATATIFIALITFEHSRTIWAKMPTLMVAMIFAILFSYFFQAPLHDNLSTIVKGPWYFVGFQEILHWLNRPAYSLLIILALILIIYRFPYASVKSSKLIRIGILTFVGIYLVLTIIGYFFRGEDWKWRWEFWEAQTPFHTQVISSDEALNKAGEIPQILGKRESCLVCHDQMQGFSPAHDPQAIGCISCHQGNPFTIDKDQSHRGMILIPGNLADANRSCGTVDCHPDISTRIHKSILNTMSGVISVDKYVFNEIGSPTGFYDIHDLKQTAADNHLRDLCASCHLGNPKVETGPISQTTFGGGCNACHLSYSEEALAELNSIKDLKPDDIKYQYHPTLSLKITDDHCFSCHSRSGRIATNYKGLHETKFEASEISDWTKYELLDDQRVFEKVSDDIHHQRGMECVDCHTSYETMGDGILHQHKETQMQMQCEDCHFSDQARTIQLANLDAESAKILETRKYLVNSESFLEIEKSGRPITNSYIDESGKAFLISKNRNQLLPLKSPAASCTKGDAHDALTCGSCHTAWAPQCIGCHNDYEKDTPTYDLLDNKMITGAWIEYAGEYYADPPTLGISEDSSKRNIQTFIPGMVLTVDKNSYDGKSEKEIFHRLFAPASGHTTMAKGRTCKSCHNDPLAIGYGRGTLKYILKNKKGAWEFTARFAPNKHDGLPEDAWIGFLEDPQLTRSTRMGMRPFSLQEQKEILVVGACLTCHEDDSKVMQESLLDFDKVLQNVSSACILPSWE